MIKGIVIKNFRIFETFKLLLNDDLNLLVGDNEAGKSTILEAMRKAERAAALIYAHFKKEFGVPDKRL